MLNPVALCPAPGASCSKIGALWSLALPVTVRLCHCWLQSTWHFFGWPHSTCGSQQMFHVPRVSTIILFSLSQFYPLPSPREHYLTSQAFYYNLGRSLHDPINLEFCMPVKPPPCSDAKVFWWLKQYQVPLNYDQGDLWVVAWLIMMKWILKDQCPRQPSQQALS